ncbi:hypothetical protein M422DRAFT_29145, partial [Sphaerobolus stellatus SS14]
MTPIGSLNDRNPLGRFTSPAALGVAGTDIERPWFNLPNHGIFTSRPDRVVYPTPTPSPLILEASQPTKRPAKKSADNRHHLYTILQVKRRRNPGTSQPIGNCYQHLPGMNIQVVKAMDNPALVPATVPITSQAPCHWTSPSSRMTQHTAM